jgi:hypothetical protein
MAKDSPTAADKGKGKAVDVAEKEKIPKDKATDGGKKKKKDDVAEGRPP